MPTESTQWRKFLQPVVTGLVALMAVIYNIYNEVIASGGNIYS